MALTNAERQARYKAKVKAKLAAVGAIPTIYDVSLDERRPVTQADVDLMLKRLEEAVNVRHAMLAALDLPMNAKAQIAHLEAIGGMYGTWKLLKREAVG